MDDILAARQAILEAERLDQRIARLTDAYEDLGFQVAGAEAEMEAEGMDVQRLRGVRPLAVWLRILGRLDEARAKQEAEHATAVMHYDALRRRHDAHGVELERACDARAALHDPQATLDRAVAARAATLVAGGHKHADRLERLQGRLAEHTGMQKEVADAQAALAAAEPRAARLQEELSAARSWGGWDMLGGGLLVTMAKHDRLHQAQSAAEDLQGALAHLNAELADIDRRVEGVQIGDFLSFADYFLDGLLFDWLVQERIEDAWRKARDLRDRLDSLAQSLSAKQDALRGDIAEARRALETLVA